MSSLGILAVGMAIVLVGVLVFRLHPFLTLILAALVVAALTPRRTVLRTALESESIRMVAADVDRNTVTLAAGSKQGLLTGTRLVALRADDSAHAVRQVATLVVLAWQRRSGMKAMAVTVQTALAGGGVIILITAAGGAFGHALRQTGIASAISQFVPEAQLGMLLPLAFLVTMIVRAAQGSATVAMITAVGIVAPLVARNQLPFHPLYVALAIGCGSKPLSWMNDSGFWVVGKMSGMTDRHPVSECTVSLLPTVARTIRRPT